MIIEIDEIDLRRYSPAALRAMRPDLVRLAALVRCNLDHLHDALGLAPVDSNTQGVLDDLHAEVCAAEARIEALEHDLATARAWIEHLTGRLAEVEDDPDEAAYRMVGLRATAHAVVVAAARRALLAHHHPDRWLDDRRAAATAHFQDASAAFDRIEALRR